MRDLRADYIVWRQLDANRVDPERNLHERALAREAMDGLVRQLLPEAIDRAENAEAKCNELECALSLVIGMCDAYRERFDREVPENTAPPEDLALCRDITSHLLGALMAADALLSGDKSITEEGER